MKLEINRAEWLRGEGGSDSALLRERDNKKCCLGFFAKALGATDDDIRDIAEPGESSTCAPWPAWVLTEDDDGSMVSSDAISALIQINDGQKLLERDREERIAAIFARHGVEVTFVDGPEAP
jgi:hypothetical protein